MQKNPIGVLATFDRNSGFATQDLVDGTSTLQPWIGVFKIRLQKLSLVYNKVIIIMNRYFKGPIPTEVVPKNACIAKYSQ